MMVLGIILLLVGLISHAPGLVTIGIIALVVGLLLAIFGSTGHASGGPRHYW